MNEFVNQKDSKTSQMSPKTAFAIQVFLAMAFGIEAFLMLIHKSIWLWMHR
jgi:hypothetical protein